MQVYMLGGRAYGSAATQTTFAQDGWIMGLFRKHGFGKVVARDGDLLGAVLEAGAAAPLLAGLLTEDRTPWSREAAVKNAAYFDGLADPADKQALLDALALLLADFFVPGGSSSTASPTSSTRRRSQRAKGNARKSILPATTRSDSAASGPTSSPPSPSAPASA